MKLSIGALGLTAALTFTVGCGDGATTTSQQFLNFGDDTPLGGSSEVKRYEDRIEVSGTVNGLTAGNLYTAWAVVFNDAAACSPPNCGVDDVAPNVPAKTDLWFGDNGEGSAGGSMDFTFVSMLGKTSVETSTLASDFGIGLTSTDKSEVHVIIVDHGAPSSDPDILRGQKQSYTIGMGCPVDPVNAPFCPFIQYAPHFPEGAEANGGHGG